MSNFSYTEAEETSLCEALDRILTKGAIIAGDLIISVANVDLIYLGLQLILTAVDTPIQIINNDYYNSEGSCNKQHNGADL